MELKDFHAILCIFSFKHIQLTPICCKLIIPVVDYFTDREPKSVEFISSGAGQTNIAFKHQRHLQHEQTDTAGTQADST